MTQKDTFSSAGLEYEVFLLQELINSLEKKNAFEEKQGKNEL